MNRAKQKGTAAETAVVTYLQAQGYPAVERRAMNGVKDRGDIAGVPGVVIEVKNCATMQLAEWVKEALAERENDKAKVGLVWHKRRGKGSPADWYVTMTGADLIALLASDSFASILTK